MPDLIAQGSRRENRWRRRLPTGEIVTIGRSSGGWSIPWDEHISRQHVKVRWDEATLCVEALPRTRNPIYFQGAAVEIFRLKPGEHFVIGQTTLTLTEGSASITLHGRPPVAEQSFSQEYLRHLRFQDPGDRLELLSKLPERIVAANEEADLHEHVIRIVFEGIPKATAVAICAAHEENPDEIRFLHWDRPDSQVFNASRRLISEALISGKTVVHSWETAQQEDLFTEDENFGWAFCTPFHSDFADGWALYIAGARDAQTIPQSVPDLREEMKFAEIVVTTIGSFHDVLQLQKREASLGQFFSEPVIHALRDGNADEALAPREVVVTVLFCDLRGFSLAAEQFADDLLGLLQRVSDALGVLTKQILKEGGVIGDFHGDAAMGFWGWPLPEKDSASRAARAALAIFDEFSHAALTANRTLSQFRIGVGIASGNVVAGKIGTVDQVKVTAFGPAVNLASRLENMTKRLCSSILLDSETAQQIRQDASVEARLRKLAIAQPYGMKSAIEIYELLPSLEKYPLLSDQHIRHYESALDAFVLGDWDLAWAELQRLPAADPSKEFLANFISSRGRIAPPEWDGVIRLDSK